MCGWRCRVPPNWLAAAGCAPNASSTASTCVGGGGLVARHRHVVVVDQPDVDAARLGRGAAPPSARPGTRASTVSKKASCTTATPAAQPGGHRARVAVHPVGDRGAGRRRRGSWRTSRPSRPAAPARCRCCWSPCRGGCAARGSAAPAGTPATPSASTETPTRRPGSCRACLACTARYPACGPPNPIGTPKRWVVPNATSAPISPGGVISVSASRSAPTATSAPRSCACADQLGPVDRRAPLAPGSWAITPKNSPSGRPVAQIGGDDLDAQRLGAGGQHRGGLRGRRRCRRPAGWPSPRTARCISVMASAAAVPSSSIDALATSRPVRSATMVWKFSSASSRPWLISGWYGV